MLKRTMKYIAVVLIVFGMVATGIGVYFIRQSRTTQVSVQAAPETNILANIIDDCSYASLPNCPDRMKGKSPLFFVPDEVDQVLREHASNAVLTYQESVSPELFQKLGHSVELPVKASYTTSEIIARVALASDIDPRLLIAIFALQGNHAWNGDGSMDNPFGRNELSFAQQLARVALELRQAFQDQSVLPTNGVVNNGTYYSFDAKYTNTASRGLYTYLAHSSTSTDFKRFVSALPSESRSFSAVWRSLFLDPKKEQLY